VTLSNRLLLDISPQLAASEEAANHAARPILEDFRSNAPTTPGGDGSVPEDTRRLRESAKLVARSVTSNILSVTFEVDAVSDGGFDYPQFLNAGRSLGARRARQRADGTLGLASPGVANYWRGWWDNYWSGTDRWEQALLAEGLGGS